MNMKTLFLSEIFKNDSSKNYPVYGIYGMAQWYLHVRQSSVCAQGLLVFFCSHSVYIKYQQGKNRKYDTGFR
jgi:hypothetical protein